MLAAAAVVLSATPAHSAYDRAMIDAYLSQFGIANLPLLNIRFNNGAEVHGEASHTS
jgi:hypothetical protein